jgi:ribosomal protein S18 acetylase RimI-like enzyme
MEYSFNICNLFGDVFITDDKTGCALLIYPDKKKTTLQSIWWDVKFAIAGMGFSNVKKAIAREAAIKSIHPNGLLYYLWFIGVDTAHQGKGIGSELLHYVVNKSKAMGRTVCLETSTTKNLPWYSKFGFSTYRELDFGYKLYCMKLE